MEETSPKKVAEEILSKGKIQEAKGKLKIAQIIFFIIAGVNLITGIGIYLYARRFSNADAFQETMRTTFTYVAIFSITIGLVYIIFAVLLKKYPKQIIIAGIAIIILKIAYGLYRSNFKPEISLELILEIIFLFGLFMSLYFYNQYKKLLADLNSKRS